jgi:23S rRNA (uracil1939-C5)-methyltransferase
VARRGARIEVIATGTSPEGDGLAEADGLDLLVPDLLAGERAVVGVEHVGRRRVGGAVVKLLRPHPERRRPPCPRRHPCGGCPLMIATPVGQAEMKRQMLAAHGIVVDRVVRLEHELGYRWSSKRVVGGRPGRVVLGSWQRGSHRLADMDGCLVDHPDIEACWRELAAAASELGIEPYDEGARRGDLRYAWARTDGRGAVLITLVTAARQTRVRELASRLRRPSGVASCVQAGHGSSLRGGDVEILGGAGSVVVELCGERVELGPLGFLQPNPPCAELAYHDLVSAPWLPERGSLAYDLYAGAGLTTRLLRRRFDRVLACEAYAESARALEVEPSTAEAFLADHGGEQPDLVVANPPRAGLGVEVCAAIGKLRPRWLHVMSCHPASMARDLERLRAAGFRLLGARAYDTLPQTAHIEVVVWLARQGLE